MELVHCLNVPLKVHFRPTKLQHFMQMICLLRQLKADAISGDKQEVNKT